MARSNRKGRRACGPPFMQLHWWFYDSSAFRQLKPGPRAVLLALLRRYNGNNNGSIGLGLREAGAKCAISDKDTVAKYFEQLERGGFIVATRKGGFNLKDPTRNRATEWRLTWLNAPVVGATKDFLRNPPN